MTKLKHKNRHKKLHRSFDELIGDFITHSELGKGMPSKTTVMELMQWSHQQTKDPTEVE